ncbi:MAG: hypothetical protein VX777_02685 [Chlamydiota bacterium]|nr:hypothetical protein [Chlamydiota bacterium]
MIYDNILVPKTLKQVDAYAEYARLDLEKAEEIVSLGKYDNYAIYSLMQTCALKTTLLGCLTIPFIALPIEIKELSGKHAEILKKRYQSLLAGLPKCSLKTRAQFIAADGMAPAKPFPGNQKVTVLSWNICCLGGSLPSLFGGVLPWYKRVDGIVNKILDTDADIICLQEVFSEECVDALYQRLKEQYAHFYLHIGPRKYSFDSNEIQKLSSGLFVASKYFLDNPSFYPYDISKNETEFIRGYGLFTAKLFNKICISTTHLQPGSDDGDKEIRGNQLAVIKQLADSRITTYLFVDTNIEYGSEEYEKTITPHFYNHYQGKREEWTCCELRDSWLTPNKYKKKLTQNSLSFEHIDAILEVKRPDKVPSELKYDIISAGDLCSPKNALSDHRALFSTISLPE